MKYNIVNPNKRKNLVKVKVGDLFMNGECLYILARIGSNSSHNFQIKAISLINGNRWSDGITNVQNTQNITMEELDIIFDGKLEDFTHLPNAEVTIKL